MHGNVSFTPPLVILCYAPFRGSCKKEKKSTKWHEAHRAALQVQVSLCDLSLWSMGWLQLPQGCILPCPQSLQWGKHHLEAAAPAHLPGSDVGSWHSPELLGLLLPLRLWDSLGCPRSEQCFLPVELPAVALAQSPFTSQYCI